VITEAIVSAFLSALSAVLGVLPDWDPPAVAGTTGMGVVARAAAVFPVGSLVWAIVALLALELALQLWDLGVWVWHQFWGSS